jgi:hypothetical protein
MKVSWGTKIAVFYITFVVFTLGMVFMAFNQDFDLVTEDYYAQEIKYQQKINDSERAQNLEESLQINITGSQLNIILPNEEAEITSGTITCFRPSDESKDFDVNVISNQKTQVIQLNKFIKGKYVLKMDWVAADQTYYEERTIIIP